MLARLTALMCAGRVAVMPFRAFVILAALTAVAMAGCGSSGDVKTGTRSGPIITPNRSANASKPTPLECLEQQGTIDPEKRDVDFWRGTNPINGTLIRVERQATHTDAVGVVLDATEVEGFATGRYAVLGPLKGKDTGSYTKSVAMCLGYKP